MTKDTLPEPSVAVWSAEDGNFIHIAVPDDIKSYVSALRAMMMWWRCSRHVLHGNKSCAITRCNAKQKKVEGCNETNSHTTLQHVSRTVRSADVAVNGYSARIL
jgi:hypothetical protein